MDRRRWIIWIRRSLDLAGGRSAESLQHGPCGICGREGDTEDVRRARAGARGVRRDGAGGRAVAGHHWLPESGSQ